MCIVCVMCILGTDNLDYSITKFTISLCQNVKKIPREFTQLTYLNCNITNITEIPHEFTQLTYLNCEKTNITEIPQSDSQLTHLECSYTKITEIPRELTQLTNLICSNTNITEIPALCASQLLYLNCENTNITEIPQSASQLIVLNCNHTKITKIPALCASQLTHLDCSNTNITEIPALYDSWLTYLNCHSCPNLVKIPLRFKKRYVNEYNFLRVPTKSRTIFNQYKKGYIEPIRLDMEIKFNEVYWAPGGQGALELFEKYGN